MSYVAPFPVRSSNFNSLLFNSDKAIFKSKAIYKDYSYLSRRYLTEM